MSASGRLSHLLDLANQGPALRTALAEEVADLLIRWPGDCPQNMRGIFESLLAKCAREMDADARARLRVQLYADPDLAARILPREAPDRILVQTIRDGGDVAAALAGVLEIDTAAAEDILHDASGHKLVVACKAAGIDRAAFSALALSICPRRDPRETYALLDSFDTIATSDARSQLHAWRAPQQGELLPV